MPVTVRRLIAAAFAATLFAAPVAANPRYASLVMDPNSGEVLHAHAADAARAPASLTKMMTLYLLFHALDAGDVAWDDAIVVSNHAASQGGVGLGLAPGDVISVADAVSALIVRSANDVAVAVAEHLAESETAFAEAMTRQARDLAMGRTVFANASGLPHPEQTTTARDMARLAQALQRDFPRYYGYFSQQRFTWRGVVYAGHNHALDLIEGADGLKTGYTDASRFNVVVSASRRGRRVTAVVLGGPTAAARDEHAALLVDRAFEVLHSRRPPARRVQVMQAVAREGEGAALTNAAYEDIVIEPERPRLRIQLVEPNGELVLAEPPAQPSEAVTPVPLGDPEPAPDAEAIAPQQPTAILAPPQPLAPDEEAEARFWAVQVGAYSTETRALARLDALTRALPEPLAEAVRSVSPAPDAGLWRARFAGFSERRANAACAAIRAANDRCFVVGP